MLEGLLIGLQTAFSIQNLLMVIGGCLIGTFIGMLPGLGPMSIIAIMIPVAISMGDPSAALILLAGVYYGAIFGGSTSSILLNAPGVAGTVASSFDGYPLAKQGKAGKALTIAAIASFCGGSIGALLLMIFAPALSSVALLFHSAEYFALMVVGLSAIAAFAGTGQVTKALMMTVLGLILATVGEGALFNMPRFTMGLMDLQSGFGFITLAMAMFALPEALFLVLKPRTADNSSSGEIKNLRITGEEAKSIAPVIGRQSFQGFFIGVLPGAGATIASFLGYAVERNIAKKEEQDKFGKGSVKGLAAPETANNAACTGSFVPLLTLGIPGSGTTAILLGALIALNVTPGPRLMLGRPADILGGDHLDVHRQPDSADPEPAIDPVYRQSTAGTAQLPDPFYSLLYADGCVYRAEQCDRITAAGGFRHLCNSLEVCRLPARPATDRFYSGWHAGRQFLALDAAL